MLASARFSQNLLSSGCDNKRAKVLKLMQLKHLKLVQLYMK